MINGVNKNGKKVDPWVGLHGGENWLERKPDKKREKKNRGKEKKTYFVNLRKVIQSKGGQYKTIGGKKGGNMDGMGSTAS